MIIMSMNKLRFDNSNTGLASNTIEDAIVEINNSAKDSGLDSEISIPLFDFLLKNSESMTTTSKMFYNCRFSNLIFNTDSVFELTDNIGNISNIYVKDSMVSAYKSSNIWSSYADRIKPLSQYTGV